MYVTYVMHVTYVMDVTYVMYVTYVMDVKYAMFVMYVTSKIVQWSFICIFRLGCGALFGNLFWPQFE